MRPGDRVTVQITKPETYAEGAAQAMNGKRGTIDRIKQDKSAALVRFDVPAVPWWHGQSIVKAFWFKAAELQPQRWTQCECHAGIAVMNGNEIQRCDLCKRFETDEDAAAAAAALLALLEKIGQAANVATVADALDVATKALLEKVGPNADATTIADAVNAPTCGHCGAPMRRHSPRGKLRCTNDACGHGSSKAS